MEKELEGGVKERGKLSLYPSRLLSQPAHNSTNPSDARFPLVLGSFHPASLLLYAPVVYGLYIYPSCTVCHENPKFRFTITRERHRPILSPLTLPGTRTNHSRDRSTFYDWNNDFSLSVNCTRESFAYVSVLKNASWPVQRIRMLFAIKTIQPSPRCFRRITTACYPRRKYVCLCSSNKDSGLFACFKVELKYKERTKEVSSSNVTQETRGRKKRNGRG